MKQAIADVRAFHGVFDIPAPGIPAFPSPERVALRRDLEEEEHKELLKALDEQDIFGVADALADKIYVAIGTALEFGIPLERVWAEVQRANMAKVDPETGTVRRREDGKVLKPKGWTPPDIKRALQVGVLA